MTPTEIKVVDQIKAIFEAKGQPSPGVTEGSVLDGSLGLDSLDFAELAVRLEKEFGRDPFSQGDTPSVRVVAELAALYD